MDGLASANSGSFWCSFWCFFFCNDFTRSSWRGIFVFSHLIYSNIESSGVDGGESEMLITRLQGARLPLVVLLASIVRAGVAGGAYCDVLAMQRCVNGQRPLVFWADLFCLIVGVAAEGRVM